MVNAGNAGIQASYSCSSALRVLSNYTFTLWLIALYVSNCQAPGPGPGQVQSSQVQSGPFRSIQVQSGPGQVQSGPVQFRSSQVLTWTWTWTKQKDLG